MPETQTHMRKLTSVTNTLAENLSTNTQVPSIFKIRSIIHSKYNPK
jgi:hypothetical protein